MFPVAITVSTRRTARGGSLSCVHGHPSISRNSGVSHAGYCM